MSGYFALMDRWMEASKLMGDLRRWWRPRLDRGDEIPRRGGVVVAEVRLP